MADSDTNLPQINPSDSQKEVTVNELFSAASPAMAFGRNGDTSIGLTWGYLGGNFVIAGALTWIDNGTLTLADDDVSYIQILADGTVEDVTSLPTDWPDMTDGSVALYEATTASGAVTSWVDKRTARGLPGPPGGDGGLLGMQNAQSGDYTFVLTDTGALHPAADTTTRTFTIPANGSVAYPVGWALTIVNEAAAGTLTLAITSDTATLIPTGATGSRTLVAPGIATAIKITSTKWVWSGINLS